MTSQRATVPAKSRGFRVVQDDPQEPASGLCVMASAGIYWFSYVWVIGENALAGFSTPE